MSTSLKRADRSTFTLVEMMVAMSILSIVLLLMLRMVYFSQQAWLVSEGKAVIYQNSRVVKNVLEQDFKSMVRSSINGRAVPYYVASHDADDKNNSLLFVIVTINRELAFGESPLCEVAYRFHRDASEPDDQYELQRMVITDQHKAYYDFHNADTVSSWYVNDLSSAIAPLPQWETVAEGIDSFSISLKSSAGNAIAKGAQSTQPIGEVIIDCSIFEPSKKFASQAEKHKTIRDFNFFFTLHSYVDEGLNPGT